MAKSIEMLAFDNSYARLPARFYARVAPTKVGDPLTPAISSADSSRSSATVGPSCWARSSARTDCGATSSSRALDARRFRVAATDAPRLAPCPTRSGHRRMKIVPTWCQPAAPRLRISLNTRRKCGFFVVTPSGIECAPSVTKDHEDQRFPRENRRSAGSKNRVVRVSGSKVAKLAAIARNAVGNYDLHRAIEVLEELKRLGEGGEA